MSEENINCTCEVDASMCLVHGEVEPTSSNDPIEKIKKREEKRKEWLDKINAKKATVALNRRKRKMKVNLDRFRRKRKAMSKSYTPVKDLKTFDAEMAVQEYKETKAVTGQSMKITPDIERILFPYFMAGASARSIHQQFGKKFDFSLNTLYHSRDFYKWEQRRKVIRQSVMSDDNLALVERMKDYTAFFDDLMSEAIIRFKNNSESGQNTNPFNTLKVTNVKDLKDLTELMINLVNGGVKKVEVEHKGKVNISEKKAARVLEALAQDDEDDVIDIGDEKDED